MLSKVSRRFQPAPGRWCPARLTLLVLILICLIFAWVPKDTDAGSRFDPDEDVMAEETTGTFDDEPEDSFDDEPLDEELFGDEPQGTDQAPEPRQESPPLAQLRQDSTLTLGTHTSLAVGSGAEWADNHVSLRHVLETLVSDRYFARLDWKARVFAKSDHRADARDKSAHLEADLREAYLQAGSGNVSLKAGSQIIVWGKADTVAVTDVAAPRDRTELMFPDLADMRFGQWAVSAEWYRKDRSFMAFASPLPETDRLPHPGTRYFRPILGDTAVDIREERPDFGDLEAGIKLDIQAGKTEMSFMGGRFFANAPVYDAAGTNPDLVPVFRETYDDYPMAGAAVSHVRENYLFKGELAWKQAFPLQGLGTGGLYRAVSSDLLDAAVGVEYNANDRYQVSAELSNRHLVEDAAGLVQEDRDRTAVYLTFTKDFLHDTLELEYNYYYQFQDANQFHNVKATYDLTDQVEIRFQYTLFDIRDERSLLWPYRNEDRVALAVRYAL